MEKNNEDQYTKYLEAKEARESQELHNAKVFVLTPSEKGGFDIIIQTISDTHKNPQKHGIPELPGGKISIEREKKKKNTVETLYREMGITIDSSNLIPLGVVKKTLEERETNNYADEKTTLSTTFYITVVPSNTAFLLNKDSLGTDNLSGASLQHFTSQEEKFIKNDITPDSLSKNSLEEYLKKIFIFDPKVSEILSHHIPDTNRVSQMLLRIKIKLISSEFRDLCHGVFSKNSLKNETKKTTDNHNPKTQIPLQHEKYKISAPNGTFITPTDIIHTYFNLNNEEKEYWMDQWFGKNGEDNNKFFSSPSLKKAIAQILTDDQKLFDIDDPKLKKVCSEGFNSLENFRKYLDTSHHNDYASLLLATYAAAKDAWKKGYNPEIVEKEFPDFEKDFLGIVRNITINGNNRKNIYDTETNCKSFERIVLKQLRKPDYFIEVKDLLRGRIYCEKGHQEIISKELVKELTGLSQNRNSPWSNIKIKTTQNAQSGDRGEECKIIAQYNGVGVEIQINDKDGITASEKDEQSHQTYELLQVIVAEFRLRGETYTEEEVRDSLYSRLSKANAFVTTTVEKVVEDSISRILEMGFFSKTRGYIDFEEVFRTRYTLSQNDEDILQELYSEMNTRLTKNNSLAPLLSGKEWDVLFDNPHLFFREKNKEMLLVNKSKEERDAMFIATYKDIVGLFFFHIKGESTYFHQNLKNINPHIYMKIKGDRDEYKKLKKESQLYTDIYNENHRENIKRIQGKMNKIEKKYSF